LLTAPVPDRKLIETNGQLLFRYTGKGVTSRQPVEVSAYVAEVGTGINFLLTKPGDNSSPSTSQTIIIPARADFVVNTVRNVVLGADGVRLCFVEHLLAAAALWGADDLLFKVDGPELPLEDGSAQVWIRLFEQSDLVRKLPQASYQLTEPLLVSKQDKQLIALPSDRFSITYLIDWQHPAIGKRWASWSPQEPIADIADARTFGLQSEHDMLGLEGDFVSLTVDGFSKPLRYEDEPIRHKLLDLLGDLSLTGVNPLAIKARFISIKAGHELDVQMARQLPPLLKASV
jgi:UDP-3-O-[3-hydroxymyristoyl] N-acetylglucosamine deacetylase